MALTRYYIALFLILAIPSALLLWLLIHPFARFWRRLGPRWAYGSVGTVQVLAMAGIFRVRRYLLAVDFGASHGLLVLGLWFLGAAIVLRLWHRRYMKLGTMFGLPELAPAHYPGRLITAGPYAWVRHPRYVQVTLALWGFAFIVNYLAVYGIAVLWMAGIYFIVLLEESEMHQRFGAAYEEYCRRVPRFIPRIRLRQSGPTTY